MHWMQSNPQKCAQEVCVIRLRYSSSSCDTALRKPFYGLDWAHGETGLMQACFSDRAINAVTHYCCQSCVPPQVMVIPGRFEASRHSAQLSAKYVTAKYVLQLRLTLWTCREAAQQDWG